MAAESTDLTKDQERKLVERLKEGDATALEELWRAHAEVLYAAVIFPRIPVRDMAEEVLQNTFLKAFERIASFTWQEHGIRPWLKTIARNLAMDVHRRHQRADKFCQGYGQYLEASEPNQQLSRPDKAYAEAEWAATLRERINAVMDSGKLNDRYQKAIVMRLVEERSREECAEFFDVKVGTFDVLFHRACKRFEAVYQDLYGDSGG